MMAVLAGKLAARSIIDALGLGGPVYALIQQPTYGWGDPMVFVPLIGGIVLFTLFLVWESRAKHPVLDLSLFRIRNFAVTNLETLIVYAGLIGAFFFITLFLQETVGYSALAAGFATTPVSLLLFSTLQVDTEYVVIGTALAILGLGASVANVPRTLEIMRWRTVKPTLEWVVSMLTVRVAMTCSWVARLRCPTVRR